MHQILVSHGYTVVLSQFQLCLSEVSHNKGYDLGIRSKYNTFLEFYDFSLATITRWMSRWIVSMKKKTNFA